MTTEPSPCRHRPRPAVPDRATPVERTRAICRETTAPLLEHIGTGPLTELTAGDVRAGLETLSGTLSTRYLQIARASLARAVRYGKGGSTRHNASGHDPGRPRRLEQAAESAPLAPADKP